MFETDKQQLDVINRRRTNERQSVFSVSNPSRQISVLQLYPLSININDVPRIE